MKTTLFSIFLIVLYSITNAQQEGQWKEMKDRYALVIGISSYNDSTHNLRYARKDAEDFRNSLIEFGKFSEENVRLLVDNKATRDNIRKNIEGWLKTNTKINDLIIIYFSGHGTQIPDADGDEDDALDECLVPYDYASDDHSTLIVDDIFAYWIRNLQSEHILIIFDNCFAGGAAKQKGISLSGMKGDKAKDDFSKDLLREVPRDGTALLAASKPEQVSFESEELENGIFTHFLIESISSAADNNLNNIIDAQELFYHTRSSTIEYSKANFKREQEPIFISTIKGGLPLFYLPLKEISTGSSGIIQKLLYKYKHEQVTDKKISILKEALTTEPSNYDVHFYLAYEYIILGEYEKAIYHYKYVYDLDLPRIYFSPPLASRIGNMYEKMNDIENAMLWYSKGIEEYPNYSGFYYSLGLLDLQASDTISAIQNLNKAIELQPLQKDTYLILFYIHFSRFSFDVATKIISDCYEINPSDYETIYWHGTIQQYFGDSAAGDSLLSYFEANSGIAEVKKQISEDANRYVYAVDGKELKGKELQQYIFESTISRYPYYSSFYKQYIKFLVDEKITHDIRSYSENYLLYSKLNSDSIFIRKYIK